MPKFVLITTTTGDHSLADQIAADLVDQRLVACAQITGPIKSVYRWEGQVEFTEEFVLSAKTLESHAEAVAQAISELHPYDVPEMIVTPIVGGSDKYLQWVDDEVRPLN